MKLRRHRPLAVLAACGLALIGLNPVASATPATSIARDHLVPPTGCGAAPSLPAGQTVEQPIDSGRYHRTYLIHLPASYDPHRATPVVLAFHGRKGNGNDIEAFSGIDALDAIAVYPRGLPGAEDKTAWEGAPYASDADDVLFISDLLDHLQATLCVDPFRIFATGKSNGAGFVGVLACQLPNRIAAFAPVAGALYDVGMACVPRIPVPVLEFHGIADPIVNYAGEPEDGLPPIRQWVADWATRDGCDPEPQVVFHENDVTGIGYAGCRDHADVQHYFIEGGGHTWPGELVDSGPGHATQTISATRVAWDFFMAHPFNGAA